MFKILRPRRIRSISLLALLVIPLCFTVKAVLCQAADWELDKQGEGVVVYTRDVQESSVHEFRGVATLNTTLPALCSVMYSFSGYSTWLYNCKSSKAVEKVNNHEGSVRIIYGIGTGIWDRDVILSYKMKSEDKSILIELESKPNLIQEEPGLVRVKKASGHWKFAPKEDGTVEVEYQLHMDPELWFPGWLINKYVPDTPYFTLLQLGEELKKIEHRSASVDCLR